jgi:microcystin-dependent protein
MRILIFIVSFFLINLNSFAQTGIGTTTPDASAKLDVSATNKGFLPPRVTLNSATDNTTIANPAEGLLVYNKGSVGLQAGYYYWNGANWATIATATSAGNGVTASDMRKIYDSVGNATTINSTGATFTVTTSGKYQIDFSASATCGNCTLEVNFQVRDGSNNNQVIASDKQTSYSNNVHSEYNGKVEVNLLSGKSYNVLVFTTTNYGYIANNDYCRVYIKQVSGNLPVTGQTVEYGIARYTGADVALSDGATVAFDATASGNLSWNSSNNRFTLKANKTYIIESSISIYGGTPSAARFQIYDYTNSKSLGNSMFMSQGGSGTNYPNANTPMKCIVTPTTDIQVGIKLEGHYGAIPGIIGSTSTVSTNGSSNVSYFMVHQIGSSAIINPWTLSGSDTYNTTGNVGIGTNTPTVALDVTGDTKVSGVLTAGGNTYPTNTGTNGYALTTNAAGAASWNAVPPVGVITAYAGTTAPTGYLICDGSQVSRTTFAALFAIIGTTYGSGNNSTTFNLPDLTGRVPVGKNAGTFSTLGTKGGEETHVMTVNEMPAHKHTTTVNSATDPSAIGGYAPNSQSMFFGTDRSSTTRNWDTAMQSTGGSAAFNVLQPYTVINYIIKF